MKKLILSLAVFTALTFSASAQENRSTDRSEMKHRKQGDHMQALNLTAEQKAKMNALRQDIKMKMDAINSNTTLTEEQKKVQKDILRKEQRAAMESLLTAEQKAKLKAGNEKNDGAGRENNMRMKEELGLSKEQADKLKALHQSTKTQIEVVKNNSSLSEEAKKAQIKAIKEKAKAERSAFLTPDQQNKMQEMKKNRKAGGKRGNKATAK